mmetsp:Transcript_34718/g.56041  ORF Transcript_34718/g.56041 Transcript_34718/m.56041 type:complete len:114 (-) Transcript_34718:62-403(-)
MAVCLYQLVQTENHVCNRHQHRIVQLQQLGCLPKTMVQVIGKSSYQCNAIDALLVEILHHLRVAALLREFARQPYCQADVAQENLTFCEMAQRPRLQKGSNKDCITLGVAMHI